MKKAQLIKNIKTAIANRLKTEATVIHSGESPVKIEFYPMVYGSDAFQYEFVWGELHTKEFYQFRLSDIVDLKVLPGQVYPDEIKEYRYTSEVELYAFYDHEMLINDIKGLF